MITGKLVKQVTAECHEELQTEHDDSFIRFLHLTIRGGLKFLALLMVAVILLSIWDVFYTIYIKISFPP